MRKIFIFLILLCFSTAAHAADNSFSGLFIGGNVGMAVDVSSTEADYTYSNLFGGAADQFIHTKEETNNLIISEFVSDVDVSYNYALSEKWYLGLGGSFFFESTREIESRPYEIGNPNNRADRPIDYRVKTTIDPKTHFAVSIQPGYAFNNRTLGYLSAAYHYMDADIKPRALLVTSGLGTDTVYNNPSSSENFNGLGLGAGIKYRISGNWFLNISGEWVFFETRDIMGPNFRGVGDESTFTQQIDVRPSWVNLKAGIYYKF